LLGSSGFLGALSQEESTYTLHAISKNVTQERELAGDPLQLPISEAGMWTNAIRRHKTPIVSDEVNTREQERTP